jgi:hypothetical protein
LAKRGAKATLRVEEILHGALPLAPGEVFEGTRYDDTFVCFLGCSDVDVGEQALALYAGPLVAPEPRCPEREACLAKCEVENPDEGLPRFIECACRPVAVDNAPGSATCGTPFDNVDCVGQCDYETRGRCAPRPEGDPKQAHVSLSPWRDPIVFARGERGELNVPLAQLEELFQLSDSDPAACIERFGQWSDYLQGAGF